MNAIELKNVTFTYEGNENAVLKNADMYVKYGEISLISGFSGEGKSTILSLICGIIPNVVFGKISGDVLIDGKSVMGLKTSEICQKVGVVLQNADSQIINSVVEDEIAFGCENFGFSADEITKCITSSCSTLKLDKNWQTRTLSGGQKQRLITASTLATKQKIIVLDEPLANLDKKGAELLMNTLKNLAKLRYAILIVEHRLDMVMPYVDTLWSISNGKIEKINNKDEYLVSQCKKIQDKSLSKPKNENVLELSSIAFSVNSREILKKVNLSVKRGERVLLLGENGCGKTTLMRVIARLNKPTKGTITQNIDKKLKQNFKADKKWFKNVGVVYQNPNYQLFMPTVFQEIAFGAESEEYANKIIELFKLKDLSDRHPQSLSEGQKRRVSIASVVATKPKVLLLDEPTVGQDYAGLRDMIEVLNKLHDETGNTMITVTHDMRCAQALCDKCFILEEGVIMWQGNKILAEKYFCHDINKV